MGSVDARAPGRVNLIGEHTDYNDGFVLPAAIAYETRAHAVLRADRLVVVTSDRFEGRLTFDLDALPLERRGDWGDYPRGVLIELLAAGTALRGADVRVTSTLPVGAGLSSSAAFPIAFALALLALAGARMERARLALLAQRSEIEHVGARAGIMDQFVCLFGAVGDFVFLDTRTLEHELVALPPSARLVIANTMVRHEHATGGYNERRAQCEAAVEALQQRGEAIAALRDVTREMLETHRASLSDLVYRRARHVITENQRVLGTVKELRAGNLVACGALMNGSHASLRDDYEVSCAELDTMTELARAHPACFGSRMTGGGFGGSTVSLVDAAAYDAFGSYLAVAYRDATGIEPTLYDGTPAAGATVSLR